MPFKNASISSNGLIDVPYRVSIEKSLILVEESKVRIITVKKQFVCFSTTKYAFKISKFPLSRLLLFI
ncbi:hypothetical protein NEQG_01183 [Nematocida parisii ERTm3]|uniref:Uncharacterized protein n=1 Tax=Nematocida parisii (strain ERTm3) TaxID=935791 RepID=I3EGZ6_NEMP3|nr:hypothetical protein NEQG_01183 [Nematocida parisii ERTm3]